MTDDNALPAPDTPAARHIVTLLDFAGPLTLDAIVKEARVGETATKRLLLDLAGMGYIDRTNAHVPGEFHTWHSTERWKPEGDVKKAYV